MFHNAVTRLEFRCLFGAQSRPVSGLPLPFSIKVLRPVRQAVPLAAAEDLAKAGIGLSPEAEVQSQIRTRVIPLMVRVTFLIRLLLLCLCRRRFHFSLLDYVR